MRPCPPLPLAEGGGWVLPRNQGRYRVQARAGSHLWHGQRTSDGLPVVLKRLWTHPQAVMRELTMHLCASSVKGVVPLLDCFWEVEHGDHRMDTCFAVLVMPHLLPLTRCFPAKNTSSSHSHHPPPTRMDLGRVREIALSLLETLHVLHVKQRVVHLDMKPANRLLPLPSQQEGDDEREGWGKQGESKVFLADFVVSRPAGTWLSVAVGTDSFMAPELLHLDDTDEEGEEEEGVEACEKLDMWSFGRTLKSMLEGVKAGRAGAGAEERALWKLVEMCCAYSPEDRPSAKQALAFFRSSPPVTPRVNSQGSSKHREKPKMTHARTTSGRTPLADITNTVCRIPRPQRSSETQSS